MKNYNKKKVWGHKPSTLQKITTYIGQLMLIALVVIGVGKVVLHFAVNDETNVAVMAKESQGAKQAEQRRNAEKAAAEQYEAQKARAYKDAADQAEQEALQDAQAVRISF
jgi:hypothetical protein